MSRSMKALPWVEWAADRLTYLSGSGPEIVANTWAELRDYAGSVNLALSRRSVFVRTIRIPNVGKTEAVAIVRIKAPELFPLSANELAFDVLLTDDVNDEGRLILAAAISASELRRVFAEALEAGFRIERTVPVALGSMYLPLSEEPTAVISRADGGVAIDIVANQVLRQSRVVSRQSIDSEVCRTFGVAGLPCGPTVSIDDAFLGADKTCPTSPLEALAHHRSDLGMNLSLPEAAAAKARSEVTQRNRVATLMAVAAGACALYAALDYSDARAVVAKKQSRANAGLRRFETARRSAETALAQASLQAGVVDRAFRPAQRFRDLITILSNRVPAGAWLTGLTMERGKPMTVRGTAKSSDDVAAYLRNLGREPRLRDVRLVFANNAKIEDTPVVQFSISGFPVGNVPIFEPSKKGATGARKK